MLNIFAYCSGLTSVTIPNGVTTIGSYAFRNCSGLTSITLSNSVTNIGSMVFKQCSNISSITSHIVNPPTLNSDVFDRSIYNNAILSVPGQSLDLYETTMGWKNFKNIVPFYDIGTSFTLNVIDDQNRDVTNEVNIVWYNVDGEELGTGNTLNGVNEDADIYYSVLLDEGLGRIYRELKMQKIDTSESNITCQLEKIGRVLLEGRISAADIDKVTIMVSVKQMLNGKYEQSYQTQTNEQGVFKVNVYDDETDITFCGDGYFDATLHRDGFSGNGLIGSIPMNLITGFTIVANIDLQKAVGTVEAEEVTAWNDGLNNIEFSLTNITKNKLISDFTVQNGNVIIKSGVDIGEEVCLVAKSKQEVFADATTTFTIIEGANAFHLQLIEFGGVDAVCNLSNNGGTTGYLYDSSGALVNMCSYIGDTLSLRHLPSGVYTLVSMGRSLLLGSMTNLADMASVGLTEGEDYVATRVEIIDGELTSVSVNEVPHLDETKFYYTTNNTYFSANHSSIKIGNYLILSAHIDFKPEYADKVNGVTLTIDMPDGCQMVEKSALVNSQPVAHTVIGKRISFVLNKEQYQSQLRFCIIPTLNKNHTITAIASFDMDGQVQQPIGTAQFEVKGMSLSVPQLTANTNITISGTAMEHSEVSIYDNDVLIGKTTSKADGTWTTNVELFKPRSYSFHDIYSKIIANNGLELTSEIKQVVYDNYYLVPEKVTMNYYNGWYKRNQIVEFNLLEGITTPSSYPFYNGADFTFLADFTRNDTTQIKDVYIKVLNSDGTIRTLPAIYDEKQNHWVATSNYSSANRLPQNVSVEYLFIRTPSDEGREESILDQATQLAALNNNIYNFFEENTQMTLIEDEEDHAVIKCSFIGMDTPLEFNIELLYYQDVERMMKEYQFFYSWDEDGDLGYYVDFSNNSIIVTAVELNEQVAFRMTLYTPDTVSSNTRIMQGSSLASWLTKLKRLARIDYKKWMKQGSIFNHLGEIISLPGYLSTKSDYDEMYNLLIWYLETFDKAEQNTMSKLLAKCPDGSYRLTWEQRDYFFDKLHFLTGQEEFLLNQGYYYLEKYQDILRVNCFAFAYTSLLSMAFNQAKVGGKLLKGLGGTNIVKGITASNAAKGIKKFSKLFIKQNNNPSKLRKNLKCSLQSIATKYASDVINPIKDLTDFKAVRDEMMSIIPKDAEFILKQYSYINRDIVYRYSKCKKKDPDYPSGEEDEPTDDKSDFKGNGSTPILDPSGYVYEAVLSNRLEGVTTTCYQKVQTEGVGGDMSEEAVI